MNQSKHISAGKKIAKALSVWVILSYFLLQNITYLSAQSIVIFPGTTSIGTNSTILITSDLINNGSFKNINDKIVFAGSAQTIGGTAPVSFYNLTVSEGSSTTVSTAGQTISGILLCNGTLNAGGNATLLSSATRTALIDGSGAGQVLGNVIMQRYLPSGFGYKYFSSPFQDATVNEFADDINILASFPSLYKYDESLNSSGWVSYINPAGPLTQLQGYSLNFGSSPVPFTADATGVVTNGGLSVTLYNHNNTYTKGFNLIGNPYPSPIDWNASSGWTKTNIYNSLYFFKASDTDQYGGAYSTYISGVSSDGIANNIIPSMQGFFVHVLDGPPTITGTLALDNSVRVTDFAHPFARSVMTSSSIRPYIRLVAGYSDDPLSYDPFCVYFDINATYDFDGQYDAYKLFNTDMNVTNYYSFGNDGSRLSINALPLNDDSFCNIRLGLKTERSGDVIFRLKDIIGIFNYNYISITDAVTGITKDLLYNNQYKVTLASGDYQNRFFLNLSNILTDIPDIVPATDWINIYSSYGILKAEINLPTCEDGILKIFNLSGQVLFIRRIYEPGYHEFSTGIKGGVYIVTFASGDRRISKKVLLQ